MIRRAHALAIMLILAAAGCATPIPPSGGPRDETPPELVEATPAQGAVNVDADFVRLTFSEYVDQASFTQAFSISPSSDRPVEFDWSGRSVVIRFPDPLRENTTYVLTIDSNLRDLHSVTLTSPIVYAFSTGPTISAGRLTGRVVASSDGAPMAGVDVLAYALPDSTAPGVLGERPSYRTQTDSEGIFTFDYLTEQFYFVPALRDDNRNLRPDPQERYAAPPAAAFFADSTAEIAASSWVLAAIDTTGPTPVRAQSQAQSRHLLRFSEPVRLVDRDPTAWTLADSSTGERFAIHDLYLLQAEPRQVHLITDELENRSYRIVPSAVADTSGNVVDPEPVYLTPAQENDTLRTRFVDFLPADPPSEDVTPIARELEPGIRFNRPISEELLGAAVSVTDSAGVDRGFIAVTANGTDYEIVTDPRLQHGERISIDVDARQLSGPDTTYARSYRRIPIEETGEIAGVTRAMVATDDTSFTGTVESSQIVVQVYPLEVTAAVPTYTANADSAGSFVFSELPAGSYRIRAFADVDNSGTWDPGLLLPYRPAEGIAWHTEPVRVRSRWETTLPDTLRIPVPR